MAFGTPSDPVGGTVATVSYMVENVLNPIRWLRQMTGNSDPPGSGYALVSTSTTGTSWSKISADMLAANAVVNHLGYTPVSPWGANIFGDLILDTSIAIKGRGTGGTPRNLASLIANNTVYGDTAFPAIIQNNGNLYSYNGTSLFRILHEGSSGGGGGGGGSVGAMVGEIRLYAAINPAPAIAQGWLLCNGQAVSRSTYSALFGVIGGGYGAGNGVTTFNVPNLSSRFPMGAGGGHVVSQAGGSFTQNFAHSHTQGQTGAASDTTVVNLDHDNGDEGVADPGHYHSGGTTQPALGTVNVAPPFLVLHYIIYAGV